MRRLICVALVGVALAACGKNSSDTSGESAKDAGISTPSKMAQQAQASSEYEADTSETAATGQSDGGGTTSKSASVTALAHGSNDKSGGSSSVSGEDSIHFSGGIDYNQIISGNFNTAFSFDDHKGPRGTDNGSVSCDVHFRGANDLNMTLTYDINQTLSNGTTISIFTDPTITVTRTGTRALGKIVRMLDGTVRRQRSVDMNMTASAEAVDHNFTFDFTIDHNNTQVTDTYVSDALSTRTHVGMLTITDNIAHSSAVIDFNNVLRGKPGTCLCPSGGSIEVTYTDPNGQMSAHTYQFGSVCGQVTVVTSGSAAVAANANTAAGTATAAAGAQVVTTETWPNCTVE